MKARDFSELQINVQPLGVRSVEFPDDISNSLKTCRLSELFERIWSHIGQLLGLFAIVYMIALITVFVTYDWFNVCRYFDCTRNRAKSRLIG